MQLTPAAFPESRPSVCCSGFSSSLAPPPLDADLTVEERLAQVKACLGQPSADRALVSYDIIQVYKVLVLSCGIGLEGSCEDPKVRESVLSLSETFNEVLTDDNDLMSVTGCLLAARPRQ